MYGGIGRSAHRHIGYRAVEEAVPVEDFRWAKILPDHFTDAHTTSRRHAHMAGVDGGNGTCAGQGQAHDIDDRRHGRGGPHGVAGSEGARHAAFKVHPIGVRYPSGPQFVPIFLGVGARPRLLATPLSVGHRSGGAEDQRQVHGDGPHQKARRGLVAAAQKHHAIERMRAQKLFGLHGQHVAIEHGRGLDHHLAHRERGQLHRVTARLPDAALHRLRPVAQMGVTRAHVAPGVDDADHRAAHELLTAHTYLLGALAMGKAAHVPGRKPALGTQLFQSLARRFPAHRPSSRVAVRGHHRL